MNKWQRKAKALVRLAEDQRGTPEGDLAREKLLLIINNHPEARDFEPVKVLVERDITMADVIRAKRIGVDLTGSWTGENLQDAIQIMMQDYNRRIHRRILEDLYNV